LSKWPNTSFPVSFVVSGPMPDAAYSAEVEVALRAWAEVPCTAVRLQYAGGSSVAAADDGVNAIYFHGTSWPAELDPLAIAQAVVSLDGNGDIHDVDIHMNLADYRFSLDGASGTEDFRSVITHELGHALGLPHSTDSRATMSIAGSGTRWRSLETADRDAICALYPGTGLPRCGDPGGASCPAGLACVASICQRAGTPSDVCSPCERRPDACEGAGDEARCIDLGSGRVCGRACSIDADCGAGFACRKTTESGDLQCVSLDGCRNGANTCTTDAQCVNATSTTNVKCQDGACVAVDAPPADAGVDAPTDAGVPVVPIEGGGEGCDCRTHDAPISGVGLVAALVALAFIRRRGR
jgi:hypothetical protein